jgi:hypothetical protein
MELLTKITAFILAPIIGLGSFLASPWEHQTPVNQPTEELGRAVNPVAGKSYTLYGSGVSASDTTVTLTSFTIPVSGTLYNMTHFGDTASATGYVTIEPGSATKQEFVSFTGITQNSDGTATLTGVQRGLAPVFPYTASTTYAKAHAGGSVVAISNPPQLYEAIYSYIDNATTSGAVDSSGTVKGLVEVATGQEAASSTIIGGGNTTAPLVLTTTISTSSSPTSGRVVPVTNNDGNIDGSFIQGVSGATFTGTTTFNAPIAYASSTVRIYTASTTYTKPGGLSYIYLEIWGGGGSGGSVTSGAVSNASGGGGGAYASAWIPSSNLAATSSIVIGAGGTAVSGTSNGNAGGITSFAGLSVYGGGPGTQGISSAIGGGGGSLHQAGANGVNAAPCNIVEALGAPQTGVATTSVNCGAAGAGATDGTSSVGGNSFRAGAGGGSISEQVGAGAAGGTSLSGGNGGASGLTSAGTAGSVGGGGGGGHVGASTSGAGGGGKVRITEFY